MSLASALMLDASFSSDLEGLLCTAVRLHLWHFFSFFRVLLLAGLLQRCEHHCHAPPFALGRELDETKFLYILR